MFLCVQERSWWNSESLQLLAWGFQTVLKLDMPSGSVHAVGEGSQDPGPAGLTQQLHSGSSLSELTRSHLHRGPVYVTLTLRVRHLQVKRVGSLDQVGKKEDRVAVRVI